MPHTNNPDVCSAHFNRVYDETFDAVKKYIAVKCYDPYYIQDILQDTYCEYYRMLLKKGTDYAKNELTVLMKIAKRCVFRYYSLKQRLSIEISLFQTNADGDEYCVADGNGECEDEEILTELQAEKIWQIIDTYPADIRKIMYLYFNEGMSLSQISSELGYTLSNVKNKLYRTLSKIKQEYT